MHARETAAVDWRAQNWEDLIPRLLLLAISRLRRMSWHGERRGAPPGAAEAEDFVNDAVSKTIAGIRIWNPTACSLFQHLAGVIVSDISHAAQSAENRATLRDGGPPMGGVGFGTSDVVIADLLAELNRLPEAASRVDFFVIDPDQGLFRDVLQTATRLRQQGFSAVFSYARQGVGKQFKQAAAAGARRVVVVEADFARTPAFTVKDMDSGRQAVLAAESFLREPMQALGQLS